MVRHSYCTVVTYSIVARDPDTGELGVAVQSHWFAVGPSVPWARPGVGAIATQANIEVSYGPRALELLRGGRRRARRARPADIRGRRRRRTTGGGRRRRRAGRGAHRLGLHPARRPRHRRRGLLPGEHHGRRRGLAGDARRVHRHRRAADAAPARCARRGRGRRRRHPGSPVGGDPGGPGRRRLVGDGGLAARRGPRRSRSPSCAGWSSSTARTRSPARQTSSSTRAATTRRRGCTSRPASSAPESHELRFWAGLGAAQAGDLERGVADVRQAIAVHPGWRTLLERLPADVAPSARAVLARLRADE